MYLLNIYSCCCSVIKSCLILYNPMDCSIPGLPIPHLLLEFSQIPAHCIGDAIQPSHPLSPSSPSAFNPSSIRVFSNEFLSIYMCVCVCMRLPGFPGGSDCKESTCNVGGLGSIPRLGRSPGDMNGNPLQYSCLENPHGQRSLEGHSSWALKESEMTVGLSTHAWDCHFYIDHKTEAQRHTIFCQRSHTKGLVELEFRIRHLTCEGLNHILK